MMVRNHHLLEPRSTSCYHQVRRDQSTSRIVSLPVQRTMARIYTNGSNDIAEDGVDLTRKHGALDDKWEDQEL